MTTLLGIDLGTTAVKAALFKADTLRLLAAAERRVATGCANLPAQALIHAVSASGEVLVTIGTGGQVFTPMSGTPPDGRGAYLFEHAVPGRRYGQAAILAGGLALRWLRDLLGMGEQHDAYQALTAGVPPGAGGLLFLPYLAGERTPHMDPQASGLFLGLRLHHGGGHLVRSVLEGVGMALRESLDILVPGKGAVTLAGGAARSAARVQILADVWNRPICPAGAARPRGAMGAALLGGVAGGVFQSVTEALPLVRGREERIAVLPSKRREVYDGLFERFRRLYPLLREEMHGLAGGERESPND